MNANQQQNEATATKENLASHYALHVALQTMKERCLSLQHRLSTVEEENLALRMKHGVDTPNEGNTMDRSEVDVLREKVGELTRQKFQLTEHIGMVAAENRQLWSRLSKLTKDNQTLGISLNKIKDTLTNTAANGHQNLIRSKTFTQNSPNPILRQKMMQDHSPTIDQGKNGETLSLEEISLKDFTESKVDLRATMHRTSTAELSSKSNNSLGFGYLNDESINTVLQNDTKKCLDNMVDIKKELLRQQSDLKVALSGLRQRRVLELCLNCKNHSTKAATVDKSVETTDEYNDSSRYQPNDQRLNRNRQNSNTDDDELVCDDAAFMPIRPDQTNRIDILQQKRDADSLDKMCPMCGNIYSSIVSFQMFQDHVESHFIDDTDLDMSFEKKFEFVSNTVGNF